MADVDGLNAGYANSVLEQYLENPESVPAEWRELFEPATGSIRRRPARALARLLETMRPPVAGGNGGIATAAAPRASTRLRPLRRRLRTGRS